MSGARKSGRRSPQKPLVAVGEHVEAWRRGLRRLTDQGRLLSLLGEGLETMLGAVMEGATGPVDDGVVAATLLGWVREATGVSPRVVASAGRGAAPSGMRSARAVEKSALTNGAAVAEGFLDGKDLSTAWCPAVWVGSQDVRGEWATLALGSGLDGLRRVLAVRAGSVRDATVAESLVDDLVERGLPVASGILVITDGSRTLDRCLQRAWGHRALLSHCRHRVHDEVISHVVEAERANVSAQLVGAWSLPTDEAMALLRDLVRRLERDAPGAAERLARSVDATLVVDTLTVATPLKDRLVSMGTCGTAFKRALEWGPSAGVGAEALAAGLKVWLGRTRRFLGWQCLAHLATMLQRTVAAGDSAPRA